MQEKLSSDELTSCEEIEIMNEDEKNKGDTVYEVNVEQLEEVELKKVKTISTSESISGEEVLLREDLLNDFLCGNTYQSKRKIGTGLFDKLVKFECLLRKLNCSHAAGRSTSNFLDC